MWQIGNVVKIKSNTKIQNHYIKNYYRFSLSQIKRRYKVKQINLLSSGHKFLLLEDYRGRKTCKDRWLNTEMVIVDFDFMRKQKLEKICSKLDI